MPTGSTRRIPIRVTTACETPENAMIVSVNVMYAAPVCSAE